MLGMGPMEVAVILLVAFLFLGNIKNEEKIPYFWSDWIYRIKLSK